jgi:hypothetical protein
MEIAIFFAQVTRLMGCVLMPTVWQAGAEAADS